MEETYLEGCRKTDLARRYAIEREEKLIRSLFDVRAPMKIAQIASLIESVPPRLYGGTERVVSYLTEEFVSLGHDVTLFASGDSVTSARLVSCATTALRLDPKVRDPIPYYMLMLDRVRERADQNLCTRLQRRLPIRFRRGLRP